MSIQHVERSSSAASAGPTSRPLVLAVGALVAADLAGGLIAVGAGLNSWSDAWGSKAVLAAPLPMIGAQVVLCGLAARDSGRRAAAAAGLLALACVLSVTSGFFDGGLRHSGLTSGTRAFQVFLLTVTAMVGVMAARRAAQAWQR